MTEPLPRADWAETEISVTIRLKVLANQAAPEITVRSHVYPASLNRNATPEELREAKGAALKAELRHGLAILDPRYASNGAALVRRAEQAAGRVRTAVHQAAEKLR